MEAIQDHKDITLGKNLCSRSRSGTTQRSHHPLEVLHSKGCGFAGIAVWAQLTIKLDIIEDKGFLAIGEGLVASRAVPEGSGQPRNQESESDTESERGTNHSVAFSNSQTQHGFQLRPEDFAAPALGFNLDSECGDAFFPRICCRMQCNLD